MRLILDRIEKTQNGKRIAVFECGDDFLNIYEDDMPKSLINTLKCGMILEAELVNGVIASCVILEEETEKKQTEMKKRLTNLFNRKKD